MTKLRIGTRGSALALWQARTVAALIEASGAGVELVVIRTAGDRLQQARSPKLAASACSSRKSRTRSSPKTSTSRCTARKTCPPCSRPDWTSARCCRAKTRVMQSCCAQQAGRRISRQRFCASQATRSIGTGSVRRAAQLRGVLPHARFAGIRGNVDTRLRKLEAGEFDALVLAAAGMRRLGLAGRISAHIPLDGASRLRDRGSSRWRSDRDDRVARRALPTRTIPRQRVSLTAERALVDAPGRRLPAAARRDRVARAGWHPHAGRRRFAGRRSRNRREMSGARDDPAGLAHRLADALARGGASTYWMACGLACRPPLRSPKPWSREP